MRIKRMLEFTNYSDDIVDKLPKALLVDDDFESALNLNITPDLIDTFKYILQLATKNENDAIDEVLMDLDEMDRRELIDSLDKLHNYINKRIEYVSRFN